MSPGWPVSPGQPSCFSQSMHLVTAKSISAGTQFPLISPGPQCRAVELTASNRLLIQCKLLHLNHQMYFVWLYGFWSQGLWCPSPLLRCFSIKGTLCIKLSEAPNSQDALLRASGESQWPKQHLYAGIHMPNLIHKTPAQTFKRGFWQFSLNPMFSLSPVLAGKLLSFSLCAQTWSSELRFMLPVKFNYGARRSHHCS